MQSFLGCEAITQVLESKILIYMLSIQHVQTGLKARCNVPVLLNQAAI